MYFPTTIRDDLVLGVARAYHDRAEREYQESERIAFDDLEDEDLEFILYESQQWLEATAEYLRSRK